VTSRLLPWAILLAAVLIYPLAVTAGGSPRFPHRSECIHPATRDGNLEAVFGRYSSSTHAVPVLRRVLAAGFTGTRIESDGCGLLKVVLRGIPTLRVGRDFVAEARGEGFSPRLEQEEP
jgi:hypothetical protein